MYCSSMLCSRKAFQTLPCSTVSECFFSSRWLRPSVAGAETCLVSALAGVQRGLWEFEEELAEEFVQDGDHTDWCEGTNVKHVCDALLSYCATHCLAM